MTQNDKIVRVGNLLRQSLNQVSPAAADTFDAQRRKILVHITQKAVAAGELLTDVDPDAMGNTILINLLGTRLLCDATGDDVFCRLAQLWRITLRGNVSPECAAVVQELIEYLAAQRVDPI